jgi:hypothetical protein
MSEFTLDTSGTVTIDGVRVGWRVETSPSGFYLDPFTQGYVEAALEFAASGKIVPHNWYRGPNNICARYDSLAPETLARIMADCAKVSRLPEWKITRQSPDVGAGKWFWRERQQGDLADFPPLTPYLGDDGRVYLREAAHSPQQGGER